MSEATIRQAEQTDRAALHSLERRHFPAVPGSRHPGYAFEDARQGAFVLLPEVQSETMVLTTVAEVDGPVEGFAVATPFRLPGQGKTDPANMLLSRLAVNEPHRRQGIGCELLAKTLERIESGARRQTAIVAHVPTSEAGFYDSVGWTVLEPEVGFAWLPFADVLHADLPDPALGFDRIAFKVLRPNRVRSSFTFTRLTGRPTLDALGVLDQMVRRGEIDMGDLDEDTLFMLRHTREMAKRSLKA